MACSRWTGLRSGPSLDFTRCRRCASLWIGRCAHASHLIVISAVDLANCHSRRIGLAHRLQSGSIVGQKTLCVWRKVIEAAELGHHKPSGKIRFGPRTGFLGNSGVRASGHDGPMVGPPTVAGVHGDRWTGSRLSISRPPGACLGARGLALLLKPPSRRWTKFKLAVNLLPCESRVS